MPDKPGVYLFLDQNKEVLYVGKAKNLKSRVSSYFVNSSQLGTKTRLLVEQIKKINITIVESEVESLLLEAFLVKKYRPKYNIRLQDNKSYPLIQITLGKAYPSILFARREDDPKSLYFGPFPNSGAVKLVLKTIRHIFPFVSVRNHPPHKCLYYHLGLCPCPSVEEGAEKKLEYKKNIRRIIKMLEGKSASLVKDLEKERDKAGKEENFEKALDLQKKITALELITQPFRKPFEYDTNPNLRTDIRQQEMLELQEILLINGLKINSPAKIECYDISNTQGTHATGSLVVLSEGEVDKSLYRRFKIKKDGKPNDFAMMEEMLGRRLKHKEWDFPDLLVVDGGKGQVSSVQKVLQDQGLKIPLIGLAKKEETIIIPIDQDFFTRVDRSQNQRLYGNNEENFIEVSLSKNPKALLLITRIRNEAHRFAITYHRKLRSKNMLSS